jgi:outer membrane protein assembly factor BamB
MTLRLRLAGLATATAAILVPWWPGSAAALAPPRPAHPAHPAAAVAAWPRIHHDNGNTGDNPLETVLGPGNAAGLHQLWLARTGRLTGIGAVAVTGGKAYLGNDGVVQAWLAASGRRHWSQAIDDSSSPVTIEGGRLFSASGAYTLYGLSAASGSPEWHTQLPQSGSITPPLAAGDVVYETGFYTMNAFDAGTGSVLWTTALPGRVLSVPALAGGRLFVSTETLFGSGARRRYLLALNAATGAVLWRKKEGVFGYYSSPVVSGGTVYLCSQAGLSAMGVVHGELRWSEPGGCDGDSTPALAGGVLYTAPSAGGIWAFDASTGAKLWNIGSGSNPDPAYLAVANGVLYVPTQAGTITAYDTASHALLWTSPAGDFTFSAPAVVNGVLYVGGVKGLYAFGP